MDKPMKAISAYIDGKLHQRLKIVAAMQGMAMKDAIAEAIAWWVVTVGPEEEGDKELQAKMLFGDVKPDGKTIVMSEDGEEVVVE